MSPATTDLAARRFKSRGLGQAFALREFAWEAMMSFRDTLRQPETGKLAIPRDSARDTVAAIVGLFKSWETADDRIRIHRGKPLPGSLRPAPSKPRQGRRRAPAGERPAFEPPQAVPPAQLAQAGPPAGNGHDRVADPAAADRPAAAVPVQSAS